MNSNNILKRIPIDISLFYETSIAKRSLDWLLGRTFLRGFTLLRKFDDNVSILEGSPLGMFVYNLRILFLVFSLAYLMFLTVANQIFLKTFSTDITYVIIIYWSTFLCSVGITFVLHKNFKNTLIKIEKNNFVGVVGLFHRYFLIDAILLVSSFVIGEFVLRIHVEVLILLLISNIFVFSIYQSSKFARERTVWQLLVSVVIPFIVIVLLLALFSVLKEIDTIKLEFWFYELLFWPGALSSVLVVIISASILTLLKDRDLNTSQEIFRIINEIVASIVGSHYWSTKRKDKSQILISGLESTLRVLVSNLTVYGYKSARLFGIEDYQGVDKPNNVDKDFILLANYHNSRKYNFPSNEIATINPSTIQINTGNELTIISIPIIHADRYTGLIELIRTQRVLTNYQERIFFKSLSEVIYFDEQSLRLREEAYALNEVDEILDCPSLEDAYDKAISLLHKYLSAEGSMLLRIGSDTKELNIVASKGFDKDVLKRNKYSVGKGLTGQCVEKGEIILVNNLEKHFERFDFEMLTNVELALGKKVTSWMAIPIGRKGDKLGLVKIVNRLHLSGFNENDKYLAGKLASKLIIVLEKFVNLNDARMAKQEALVRAEIASKEEEKARNLAAQRRQDLITHTHQLQAPLVASLSRMSLILEEDDLSFWIRRHLEFASSLLIDALDLIFGILVATGLDAGQKPFFGKDNVVARDETKAIVERVNMTMNRPDLKFIPEGDENFPVLKIDKRVFRSVMYTLIHNAAKYADKGSSVYVECGFEWPRGDKSAMYPAIKVKSVGPEILHSEKEIIFDMFKRGKNVSKTGRYGGPSVGLGLWVARKLMNELGGDLTLELDNYNRRLSIFVIHFKGLDYGY